MKSIMLDIETLGTNPDAAVISVGMCAFNQDKGVIASDGWAINCRDWHGEINPHTVKWWSEQNEVAREFSFNGSAPAMDVAAAILAFHAQWGGDECWANDPDFDLVILRKWWARTRAPGQFPIHYREARSCRTIYAEARRLGIFYEGWGGNSVAHHPTDDACSQARAVVLIRNKLTGTP